MVLGLNITEHLFITLPKPTALFTGQTIILTGATGGMGVELAKYLVSLQTAHLILAVRSQDKGLALRSTLLELFPPSSERPPCKIEVWELDLASYDSVKAFAARVDRELDRLDLLANNAATSLIDFSTAEDNETVLTVNVVSTLLLTLLLLPKLKHTAETHGSELALPPRISIVSSEWHFLVTLPLPPPNDTKHKTIFALLNDPKTAAMTPRYNLSKLMQLLMARSLSSALSTSSKYKEAGILVNVIDPGIARSGICDQLYGWRRAVMECIRTVLQRSSEHGARGVLWGFGGETSWGGGLVKGKWVGEPVWKEGEVVYVGHCRIREPSPYVRSEKGKEAQEMLWEELMVKMEEISPGVTAGLT